MVDKLFIRAEGNNKMGLGHLVRTTALAQMVKELFNITFFCSSAPSFILSEWERNNFHWKLIDYEEEFLNEITVEKIVVLDGYQFTTEDQKNIIDRGAKLVCIDDLHDREFLADLIINHAPGITAGDYHAKPDTQFALGFEYLLLRPAFRNQFQTGRKVEELSNVFICFGGSDNLGLTEKTIRILKKYDNFKRISVVTGPAFIPSPEFTEVIDEDGRVENLSELSDEGIIREMTGSDLAIVPSSSIMLEALAVRLPIITGYYSENQRALCIEVEKLGLAISCKNLLKNYSENLSNSLDRLTVRKGNEMIDQQENTVKYSDSILSVFKSLK